MMCLSVNFFGFIPLLVQSISLIFKLMSFAKFEEYTVTISSSNFFTCVFLKSFQDFEDRKVRRLVIVPLAPKALFFSFIYLFFSLLFRLGNF